MAKANRQAITKAQAIRFGAAAIDNIAKLRQDLQGAPIDELDEVLRGLRVANTQLKLAASKDFETDEKAYQAALLSMEDVRQYLDRNYGNYNAALTKIQKALKIALVTS